MRIYNLMDESSLMITELLRRGAISCFLLIFCLLFEREFVESIAKEVNLRAHIVRTHDRFYFRYILGP